MGVGFKELRVYKLAYGLTMEIFELSKTFPKEETYSLTDQIRRSSRAVCSNLAEGYRKRKYPRHFLSKLTDCDSEASETTVWIDFAFDCNYITEEKKDYLNAEYDKVGKMLGNMINNPEKFSD